MNAPRVLRVGLAAVLLVGCGGGSKPEATSRPLGGSVAARVGTETISVASIARVARAQNVDAAVARDLLVRDALFASAARSEGIDVDRQVSGSLARRLLASLLAQADAKGPVTDAELDTATQRYWLDIDRPEGVRTVHALARIPEKATDDQKQLAAAFIDAVRQRALGLADLAAHTEPAVAAPAAAGPRPVEPDELARAFIEAANAIPHPGVEIVVEKVSPVAADNRFLDASGATCDPAYTSAAVALRARGDISPPTKSAFGLHEIMLLERTRAVQFSSEERRRKVHDTVIKDRARAMEHDLLTPLRPVVVIEHNADALLAEVPVAP